MNLLRLVAATAACFLLVTAAGAVLEDWDVLYDGSENDVAGDWESWEAQSDPSGLWDEVSLTWEKEAAAYERQLAARVRGRALAWLSRPDLRLLAEVAGNNTSNDKAVQECSAILVAANVACGWHFTEYLNAKASATSGDGAGVPIIHEVPKDAKAPLLQQLKEDVTVPQKECCKALADLFSAKFQSECACLTEIVRQTRTYTKSMIDDYGVIARSQCKLTNLVNWNPCGAASPNFDVSNFDAQASWEDYSNSFKEQTAAYGRKLAARVHGRVLAWKSKPDLTALKKITGSKKIADKGTEECAAKLATSHHACTKHFSKYVGAKAAALTGGEHTHTPVPHDAGKDERATAVSQIKEDMEAPDPKCCTALADLFSEKFQSECACKEGIAKQTKAYTKSILDDYGAIARDQCKLKGLVKWNPCGTAESGPAPAAKLAAPGRSTLSCCRHRDYAQCTNANTNGFTIVPGVTSCTCGLGPGGETLGSCESGSCQWGSYTVSGGGISPGCSSCSCCTLDCGCHDCFPADALVEVQGQGTKAMKDLEIGDRVKAVNSAGLETFEDVYFFGHRSGDQVSLFYDIEVEGESADSPTLHLVMTRSHFVQVLSSGQTAATWSSHVMMRAKDVKEGARVFVPTAEGLQVRLVANVTRVLKEGLYNPYTLGGHIVVNGVLASTHSEWILDPLFDFMGKAEYLPAAYQVLFAPLRVVYKAIGASWMDAIMARLKVASLGPMVGRFVNSADAPRSFILAALGPLAAAGLALGTLRLNLKR